jgi:hypothetical protein
MTDQEIIATLRTQIQACQSSQRLALRTAADLRAKFLQLAMLIPARHIIATHDVLERIDRLIAQLRNGGGQ